ncbi:MAG: phage holin, partial [Bacillota bacterium]|nr:phage holin [Bacillota bacterium]
MDWKTRFKNKTFLVSLISALMIAAQLILQPFNIKIENDDISTALNGILTVLAILGIVVDPTTPGLTDRLKRANMPTRQYKLKRDVQDTRDLKFVHYVSAAPSVDLRPGMPPIDDQGDLGSCSANALIGIMGYLMLKAKVPFVKLSRLYAYYKERALDGNINEDCGSTVRNECKVASKGICEEKVWPYVISKFAVTPSPESDENAI